MTNRLAEKVCIITGTGGGMGREAALTFAREGALVVGCGLYVEDAEATVADVRAAGGTMVSIQPCDLTKAADCQALVDFAVRTYGRIDVLFNNAAMAYFNWIEDISDEEWDRSRRSEVDLVFYLTRAAWPHLRASRDVVVSFANGADELQESRITRTHDGQGRDHRHDPATGDGRSRIWDPREFDFTRSDRNQPDARATQGS
jgi:NAD(P)-dependent dehydrogenase (short-subunit alcohol dehydrogenase family)